MKISFYNRDGQYTGVFEELTNPKFIGESIVTDTGMVIDGLAESNFILVEDDEDFPETYEEAKLIDKRNTLSVGKTLAEENAELKEQIQAARNENEMNAMALMELTEIVLGGGI